MAINIFTQFGIRAGASVVFAYAFGTPSAWVNNNTATASGPTVCDETTYVVGGSNITTEARCVFGSWGNRITRSSFTSNLPACGQGVVQSRALTRTRTGSTSSFSYSERVTITGTTVFGNWNCTELNRNVTTSNQTVTSCEYNVIDQFFTTSCPNNYNSGCPTSVGATRSPCSSTCVASGGAFIVTISSCTLVQSTQPVSSCGNQLSNIRSFTSSSNQSVSATPGNGCYQVTCSQQISCTNTTYQSEIFPFGQCTGGGGSGCNTVTCTNYSGTTCNWSGWSGWGQVSSCTSSTPGCSQGATQRECASETRTGQLQNRTIECIRSVVQ